MTTTPTRPTLVKISTSVLERIRDDIERGVLVAPVDRSGLAGIGIRDNVDLLMAALAGQSRLAALGMLNLVLAERAARKKRPELVWTGPEASTAVARDTAIVLRELFEGAKESVILAGYWFTKGGAVLEPLYKSMRDKGVTARFFVHVEHPNTKTDLATHVDHELRRFVKQSWPFGPPIPEIYFDNRHLDPSIDPVKMHAKCVVVDGERAFVSSANFTYQAHERNIEVGVLLDDPSFARFLAAQWNGLVEAGLVGRFVG